MRMYGPVGRWKKYVIQNRPRYEYRVGFAPKPNEVLFEKLDDVDIRTYMTPVNTGHA